MTSTTQSQDSQAPDILGKTAKYWNARGKLKLWSGILANQSLQHFQAEQAKNQAAEAAAVRKAAWGDAGGTGSEGEDVGGNTILGDVTQAPPVIIAGNQSGSGSGLVKALAAMAIGAAIPGAGLAGYLVPKLLEKATSAPIPAPSFDGEKVDLGLGRIEDFLRAGGE